jgi:aminoglycoside 2'-N-acetyltransferase I
MLRCARFAEGAVFSLRAAVLALRERGRTAAPAQSRPDGCDDHTVTDVGMAHTADLDAATLRKARSLLEAVFGGDLSEHDWDHALGGVHALVWEDDELVGHASVVQRRLLHGGRALRAGYVEGVGVSAHRRGHGHGAAMMAALERVIRGAYDLGALGSTEAAAGFYAACGWRQWEGPTSALTPAGIARTEGDDGWVYVLPVAVALDLSGPLVCDWRDGDVW